MCRNDLRHFSTFSPRLFAFASQIRELAATQNSSLWSDLCFNKERKAGLACSKSQSLKATAVDDWFWREHWFTRGQPKWNAPGAALGNGLGTGH
jgi:hypothetical protein